MAKRFAVIGTGLWGGMHAKVYRDHPGAELAAVCDLDGERARAVAADCGAPKAYTDWRDVAADGSIDAVSVVTPDFAHADIVIACARAGKHVLVEKPMAMTVPECEQMIQAAKAGGAKLMVDFHNRWNPPFHLAHGAIRRGEIGQPRFAYCRLSNTTYVPLKMLSWAAKSSSLWFLGSHTIDIVCWLLGEWPQRVYSVSRREVLKKLGVDAPDFFQSILEFPSGAVATVENTWILPESFPTVVESVCELIGTEGRIDVDTHTSDTLRVTKKDGRRYQDVLGAPVVFDRQLGFTIESIKHFADCVIQDKTPLIPAEDGLEVTRIACAIEQSAATGQPVTITR
jgi:predicted dehydrogenase